MIALALWSVELEPGKKFSMVVEHDFRISLATLGEKLVNDERTSVVVYRTMKADSDDEDEEEEEESIVTQKFVLANLIPGKIESQSIDLTFVEEEEVQFEVTGKNIVYLSGNYIDQEPQFPNEDEDEDEDEDDYLLDEIPSDVELDPQEAQMLEDDDSRRFEEIDEEDDEEDLVQKSVQKQEPAEKASNKRPLDDVMDEDKPLSKSQLKKLKKKLKAANGEAVAPDVATTTEAKPTEVLKEKKDKKDKKEKEKDKGKGKDKKEGKQGGGAKSEKKTLADGIVVEDKTEGDGATASKGKTLSMRYILRVNGQVVDKNVSGKPFRFHLGKGEVIKGWDEGLVGMRVGGERKLTVSPEKGYGSKKLDGIPPNSTLHFEVKLLDVK